MLFGIGAMVSPGWAIVNASEHARSLSEKDAYAVIIQKVHHDLLYKSWTNATCLSFIHENVTQEYVDLTIREKHEGTCPGDPNTQPVVDRFRVLRLNGKLLWYDVVRDEYVAYERVFESRKK